MKELKGKVAVITGAASGIGKALAVKAAAAGMKLVLADIDARQLDATLTAFVAGGCEAVGLRTDVSKEADVLALADLAYGHFGAVHVLVNNAGVAMVKPAWETTQADWEWVMGVNFYGVTNGLRAFIPRMLAAGDEGHIVNTASVAGLLSSPGMAAYNASKHAVVTVSEGLAHDLELRKSRLKVSVLCPAWVKTGISNSERNRDTQTQRAAAMADPVVGKIAMSIVKLVENGISPEEIAEQVFDAIAAERFYIITHANTLPSVETRMNDILQGRQPSMLTL